MTSGQQLNDEEQPKAVRYNDQVPNLERCLVAVDFRILSRNEAFLVVCGFSDVL